MITNTSANFFPQLFPQFAIHQLMSLAITSIARPERGEQIPEILPNKSQNRLPSLLGSGLSLGMENTTDEIHLRTIDIAGLRSLLGLGRTATYELIRDPGFPEAYGISARHFLWDLDEVEAWIRSRKGVKPSARHLTIETQKVEIVNGIRFEKLSA
jgi:predicted DNA-binding transcriptional regulator AlpA